MWSVSSLEVKNIGRTPGGDAFTKLVDAIIRAHAHFLGIRQASIHTNEQTNLGDGGVDTCVDAAAAPRTVNGKQEPGDPYGWLNERTIWQYKASDLNNVESEMSKEVNKPYTKKCIEEGYAYRLCICTEITAQNKANALNELTKHVRDINPGAPDPLILSAGDIAAWASALPAVVLRFFRPLHALQVRHLRAWGEGVFGNTPTFIPVPAWQAVEDTLKQHLHWTTSVPDVVLPIREKQA